MYTVQDHLALGDNSLDMTYYIQVSCSTIITQLEGRELV